MHGSIFVLLWGAKMFARYSTAAPFNAWNVTVPSLKMTSLSILLTGGNNNWFSDVRIMLMFRYVFNSVLFFFFCTAFLLLLKM